ncbi:hypothetical protein [Lacunimicrobium album]
MSIDLSPQTVAMIEQKMQTGQFESVDELLQVALENAFEDAVTEDAELQESLESLNRGLADVGAGRVVSRDEFERLMEERLSGLSE